MLLIASSKVWQRDPVVFYEPILYPIEVLEGDVIVTPSGSHLVIQQDMTLNMIVYNLDMATIKGTRHITLWEYLIGGKD